jgi:hypothetical protein
MTLEELKKVRDLTDEPRCWCGKVLVWAGKGLTHYYLCPDHGQDYCANTARETT